MTLLTLAWWKVIVAALIGATPPSAVFIFGLRRFARDLRVDLALQREEFTRAISAFERMTRDQRDDAIRALGDLAARIK